MRSKYFNQGSFFALFVLTCSGQITFDFDDANTVGFWNSGSYSWIHQSGATSSVATGPSYDHTTGSGFYFYVEASLPNYPSIGPYILENDLSTNVGVVSFYYHMYGGTMGSLQFDWTSDGINWNNIWSKSGDQGDSWQQASFTIGQYVDNVRFYATTGSNYESDIAIDDFSYYNVAPTYSPTHIPTIPQPTMIPSIFSTIRTNDFDSNDFGFFTTSTTYPWTLLSGATTSVNGPSYDHTTGSGYYAYVEASSPNHPYVGPFTLDLSISYNRISSVSFYYHMYGNSMGELTLQSSSDGTIWYDSWNKTGNQGDSWQAVDLSFSSSTIRYLRFSATTGSSYESDIAIDDFSYTMNTPTSVPTPLPSSLPTAKPSFQPSSLPTLKPSPVPTQTPQPTLNPTPLPTYVPTPTPTPLPTLKPTPSPTHIPTSLPTYRPTLKPTPSPTPIPTLSFSPSPAPTSVPTPIPTPQPTVWIDVLENVYWVALGCATFLVCVITGWVYLHHVQKERIGSHAFIGISSAVDFVLDVAWSDLRLHCQTSGVDKCESEKIFGIISLVFIIVPLVISTMGTVYLIYNKRNDLDTSKLTNYDNITLIFLIFTNPECVILLPWKEDAYHLEDSPFPNKMSLALSMAKGVEDIPQIILQVSYTLQFGGDAVTWVSIATTVVSLVYLAAAKIIEFCCKAEQAIAFDNVEAWEKRDGWKGLCLNQERNRFLLCAEIFISKDRKLLIRYMDRTRIITIGDILDLSSDDLKRMGIETKTPYKNIYDLVQYCNHIFKIHQQKDRTMVVPEKESYLNAIGYNQNNIIVKNSTNYMVTGGGLSSSSKVAPEPVPPHHEDVVIEMTSVTPLPPPSTEIISSSSSSSTTSSSHLLPQPSQPSQQGLIKKESFQLKSDLMSKLSSVGLDKYFDPLWSMGVRHSKMLKDLTMEDFKESNIEITKIQLRSLHNLAQEEI